MIERPDKLNNQAILLASDGDYTSAIACFKRAILIERDNYLLWYNLGVTYRDCGDFANSYSALLKSHQINPENDDVLETLAAICLELKMPDKTVEFCEEGLERNDSNPHFWNLLGVTFFQEEMFIEASESFEMAVSFNPYYLDALINLHDTYEELGNENGRIECEKRIKEIS